MDGSTHSFAPTEKGQVYGDAFEASQASRPSVRETASDASVAPDFEQTAGRFAEYLKGLSQRNTPTIDFAGAEKLIGRPQNEFGATIANYSTRPVAVVRNPKDAAAPTLGSGKKA